CAVASVAEDGEPHVYCWGADQAGQLGDNQTSDRASPVPTKRALEKTGEGAAGAPHTCARPTARPPHRRGPGADRRPGPGGSTMDNPLPNLVLGPEPQVVSVAAGDAHTCAALADGSARCWGAGADGQIGDGAGVERDSPTGVATLDAASSPDRVQ